MKPPQHSAESLYTKSSAAVDDFRWNKHIFRDAKPDYPICLIEEDPPSCFLPLGLRNKEMEQGPNNKSNLQYRIASRFMKCSVGEVTVKQVWTEAP